VTPPGCILSTGKGQCAYRACNYPFCEYSHPDRAIRNAMQNLAAWANIIERPSADGDNRLDVSDEAADNLARDIRTVIDAIAAGSRRAKTPKAVECEASQSGGEAASPKPSQEDPE